MKRSSVIGPLLLILIGGLFLVNNLRPELPMLEIMARYWPFLLIAWGALRLLEIVYWAVRGRALPAAGISGGEWTLVVLITIIGSGLFMTHRWVSRWPHGPFISRGVEVFGESYDFPLAAQKTGGKTPRVVIENLRGNARIVGVEGEEIKVSGRKTIRAFQQGDANTANQQSPLEILTQGERIVIRTNLDRVSGESRVSADLEITVPKAASVEARGRYGDFDIGEITGGVELDSDNAGVRLNNIGGNIRADLRRSDIVRAVNVKGTVDIKGRGQDVELENIEGQVTISGSFSGDQHFRNLARPLRFDSSPTSLSVEKTPGQIRMALGQVTAENLVGPVRLKARSRDVEISDYSQALEIMLERGDIQIRPGSAPLGKLDVETRSGNIQLAIPPGAGFDLNAIAKRGEVVNDYGAGQSKSPVREDDLERGGARLDLKVGQGPELKLTTGRGTITVRRSSRPDEAVQPPRAPLPPAAPRLPVDRQ